MRTRSKLLFAGLTTTLLLAAAITSASAVNLSVSNQQFRVMWSSVELRGGGGTVRCPLTLEGRFHSATVRKIVGALVGNTTRSTIASSSCTGGTVTINQESLPWHIRYRGFRGRLPNITGTDLELIGTKLTVEIGGVLCTTGSTAANPDLGIAGVGAGGQITGFTPDENTSIPLRGNFFCGLAGNGRFAGTGAVSQLGTTSTISIRLI